MWNGVEFCPGGTYLLDDFTIIQVVAVDGSVLHFRKKVWPRRTVLRRIGSARLRKRIRAEVSGDFFPEIALPGLYCFSRPAAEAIALGAYMAECAKRRPFAGS